jgi:DNA polymerase IV
MILHLTNGAWRAPDRPRSVVHLNVADFAVAVERLLDRRLKERPVIMAPEGAARAVVYDMSEEAYGAGVRKNMPLRAALRCCRDAVVLPPHPDRYERAMHDLLRETLPYSPLIEPGDVDGHLFIDVTGTNALFGPPVDVAWRMYRRIKTHMGLSPMWSVAPNKLVAKVATRLVKPMGEYIVGVGEEAPFLLPLPIFLIPGIERGDLIRLRELNLSHVYQVAAMAREQLEIAFGNRAGFVFDAVRGIDAAPVLAVGQKPPKIAAEHAFGNDTNEVEIVENRLYQLVEKLGAELRRQGKAAPALAVTIDHSDGVRRVRQKAVQPASANDLLLFQVARSVLHMAWTRRVRLRHIRLTCEKPIFPPAQMALFPDAGIQKKDLLIAAMDRIRDRFGHGVIHMGRALSV